MGFQIFLKRKPIIVKAVQLLLQTKILQFNSNKHWKLWNSLRKAYWVQFHNKEILLCRRTISIGWLSWLLQNSSQLNQLRLLLILLLNQTYATFSCRWKQRISIMLLQLQCRDASHKVYCQTTNAVSRILEEILFVLWYPLILLFSPCFYDEPWPQFEFYNIIPR